MRTSHIMVLSRGIVLLCIVLLLSSCQGSAVTGTQSVSLESVDTISIENGSTPVVIESAKELRSLEISITAYDGKPVINIDQDEQLLKVSMNNHAFRIFNMMNKPSIQIRVPMDYTGNLQVISSSGRVTANHIRSDLSIEGKSGSIQLNMDNIRSNLQIASTSGNVTMNLGDKNPDVNWVLKSKSGRRSHALDLKNIIEERHSSRGMTGKGTHYVEIETTSGNIAVN